MLVVHSLNKVNMLDIKRIVERYLQQFGVATLNVTNDTFDLGDDIKIIESRVTFLPRNQTAANKYAFVEKETYGEVFLQGRNIFNISTDDKVQKQMYRMLFETEEGDLSLLFILRALYKQNKMKIIMLENVGKEYFKTGQIGIEITDNCNDLTFRKLLDMTIEDVKKEKMVQKEYNLKDKKYVERTLEYLPAYLIYPLALNVRTHSVGIARENNVIFQNDRIVSLPYMLPLPVYYIDKSRIQVTENQKEYVKMEIDVDESIITKGSVDIDLDMKSETSAIVSKSNYLFTSKNKFTKFYKEKDILKKLNIANEIEKDLEYVDLQEIIRRNISDIEQMKTMQFDLPETKLIACYK